MNVTIKPLVKAKELETTLTTQYEALGLTARIDAAILVNTSGATRTVSVYIVPAGSSADSSNRLIQSRGIASGQSYLCSELIGQSLGPGDLLVTQPSGGDVTFMVSGVEIVS